MNVRKVFRKRLIDYDLKQWSLQTKRKPLLLLGARQVGKTHAVRALGKSFANFVEINFEDTPRAELIFEKDLYPERIIRDLSALTEKQIIPGKTLLFFDEIQAAPQAILALRYFYEKIPELHVIAAGSLLDFAIELVGIPVGHVLSLYMYPMTFAEFLLAMGNELLLREILAHDTPVPLNDALHLKALELVGQYFAIGGMPEAVQCWREKNNLLDCALVHHALIDTYRQDFTKYARVFQLKYIEALFDEAPRQLGTRFKYSHVPGEYRKRDLAPCLDLLETAGILRRVHHTAAQGIPLGSQMNPEHFKVIFCDIALAQAILGMKLGDWIIDPFTEFINKGNIVDVCVGQELLGYFYPHMRGRLFY